MIKSIFTNWQKPILINPLITFRVLFGALMVFGAIRFIFSDWIQKLYVEPTFFFKFYGFEWIIVPSETGCYILYSLIIISAIGIMLGAFYRLSAITFFLTFTYSELLDATNYLNHYYLVILLAFLLIFLPANRKYAIDVWRKPNLKLDKVPAWTVHIIVIQLCGVYFFAGLAKINPDWIFHAMPMAIWLPERTNFPILGYLFQFKETAYIFSYFGAFYDLTIAFFLLNRKTRPLAYIAVIIFHVLTKLLFNIGLFPMIMIFSTLIFFSGKWHEKVHNWIIRFLKIRKRPSFQRSPEEILKQIQYDGKGWFFNTRSKTNFLKCTLVCYILIQVLLPFRHLLYPNHLFWSEEGYRFSWRVMLVEKHGLATFTVADSETSRKSEIVNGDYLTYYQEKQMAIQPDFILQFAHLLAEEYKRKHGFVNPIVTVDAHVAMNGRISKRLVKADVNLAEIEDGFLPKTWITDY
ncbi:MAG: hypothetical protein ACI97N_000269 [Cognaticolwellia sp.]|jgi:hypothetical protein